MTVEEAKTPRQGQTIYTYGADVRKRPNKSGKRWYHARVTSVKTWKTRPDNVEVHCVYGLKDFFTLSLPEHLEHWHSSITHDEGDER